MEYRIPVDQTFASVDQPLIVETYKDLMDGIGESFVHGEAFTAPVEGGTHSP